MKTTRMGGITLMLALVAILGFAGFSNAQGHGANGSSIGMRSGNMVGLTLEKQAVVGKIYADFNADTAAARQQRISKLHELNAQLFSTTPDDKKVQALTKEVSELNVKLFEAEVALQSQLTKQGLPAMGGIGMMGGMSCPMMGNGMGMDMH